MKRSLAFCVLIISLHVKVAAQSNSSQVSAVANLVAFFQGRLTSEAPPPSYEELLKVVDPIAGDDSKEIRAALPFIFDALNSNKNNLAVEAGFALYLIAQRPDGAELLRTRVSTIAALLERPDERLTGGAVLTLRFLTSSIPEVTVPLFLRYLGGLPSQTL